MPSAYHAFLQLTKARTLDFSFNQPTFLLLFACLLLSRYHTRTAMQTKKATPPTTPVIMGAVVFDGWVAGAPTICADVSEAHELLVELDGRKEKPAVKSLVSFNDRCARTWKQTGNCVQSITSWGRHFSTAGCNRATFWKWEEEKYSLGMHPLIILSTIMSTIVALVAENAACKSRYEIACTLFSSRSDSIELSLRLMWRCNSDNMRKPSQSTSWKVKAKSYYCPNGSTSSILVLHTIWLVSRKRNLCRANVKWDSSTMG